MKMHDSIKDLLPHRHAMLLIDSMIEITQTHAKAQTIIREDNLFLRDNLLEECVFIELIAQTIAAHTGYHLNATGQQAGMGYLVGADKVVFSKTNISVGDVLTITIEEKGSAGALGLYYGEIRRADI